VWWRCPPTSCGAQKQRSLEHFSIGRDLIPREMITAYAILKRRRPTPITPMDGWTTPAHRLIVQTCDEILAGQHHEMFPLHVWMTGTGTQFNMNVTAVGNLPHFGGLALQDRQRHPADVVRPARRLQ
jgi:fumarate hydratase, class II